MIVRTLGELKFWKNFTLELNCFCLKSLLKDDRQNNGYCPHQLCGFLTQKVEMAKATYSTKQQKAAAV